MKRWRLLVRATPLCAERLESRLVLAAHPLFDTPPTVAAGKFEDRGSSAETSGTSQASELLVPVSQVPEYHSLPGAPHAFYLDFTGDIVSGTEWNFDYYESRPIHAQAFDIDGNASAFSAVELDTIHEVWQRVSEDFRPFNVDVTTVDPRPLPFGYRMARILVTRSEDSATLGGSGEAWFPNAGGVAFVGSYATLPGSPGWVFHDAIPKSAKGIAEAASHELGHILGLSHHGDSDHHYYEGHGEGETGWAPIMGSGYDQPMTQWSEGSYEDASASWQDDIDIITNRFNRIHFREDDHANDASTASSLAPFENGLLRGEGIIETRTDLDMFRFDHPGGPVNIQISPFEVGGNLDAAMSLTRNDALVGYYSPQESVAVEITENLPSGTYFIEVDGVGYTPENGQGYSDYGSLGAYQVEVRLDGTLSANAGGPYSIDEGTPLTLDAGRSFGISATSQFHWDLDQDGQYDDASGMTVDLSWEDLGQLPTPIVDQTVFEIGLRVTNAAEVATAATTVTVGNVAPQVQTQALQGYLDSFMLLHIEATDVRADPLFFEWDFGDGSSRSIVTSNSVLHIYEQPGQYTVTVNVGDDEGAATQATFLVTIVSPGDLDNDGSVDFADFLVLSANFGKQDVSPQQGDIDGDGEVGFSDFLVLSANFSS